MEVCTKCFNDYFIKDQISQISNTTGSCESCGSTDGEVADLNAISPLSETIFSFYEEVSESQGRTFVQCLNDDWKVFSDLVDYSTAEKILKNLYQDFEFIGNYYTKNNSSSETSLWKHLREELISENRFFPLRSEFLRELEQIFPALLYRKEIDTFFRARISDKPLGTGEMGKPPRGNASGGRANPVGISYLYVASDKDTAIAEVRPQKEDVINIAKFTSEGSLKLLDLRNPMRRLSPFELASFEIDHKHINKNLVYLTSLGKELSKPVNSQRAKLEYIPTQFLCEFIKHSNLNFDGVVYKSSVGKGFNIAIFNDSKLKISSEIIQYKVNDISYSSVLNQS